MGKLRVRQIDGRRRVETLDAVFMFPAEGPRAGPGPPGGLTSESEYEE